MKFNFSFFKIFAICTCTFGVVNFSSAQYCSSSSIAASFCSTSLVSIGSLNNASSGCANYSDYTSIYTELVLNMYNLTIGLKQLSDLQVQKFLTFIDWNGNESFDVDEEVFHINATRHYTNQTNFSTTITVPANASRYY